VIVFAALASIIYTLEVQRDAVMLQDWAEVLVREFEGESKSTCVQFDVEWAAFVYSDHTKASAVNV
jgi:hypothetical protein